MISFGRVEMVFEAQAAGERKAVNGRIGGMASGKTEGRGNTLLYVAIAVAVVAVAVAAYFALFS